MANFDALRDLTGNLLDGFAVFASGSTPDSVAMLIETNIRELDAGSVSAFTSVLLLAAIGQRRLVEEFLAKPESYAVMNFLRARFYVQNHINYSALNLAGHCLMAGAGPTEVPMIAAFRGRLGSDSIWDSDLVRATISDGQRRIFQEKVRRFGHAEARDAGIRIIEALRMRYNMIAGDAPFPITAPYRPPIHAMPGLRIGEPSNRAHAGAGTSSFRPPFPPNFNFSGPVLSTAALTFAAPIMATAAEEVPIITTAAAADPVTVAATVAAVSAASDAEARPRRSSRNVPSTPSGNTAGSDAVAGTDRTSARSLGKRPRT